MSALETFMDRAQTYGRATLDDHLTEQGFLDPAKRRAMRAQATRALKPGGAYRHLAEKGIVVPSTAGRGRSGSWEEGLTAAENSLTFSPASDAFAPLRLMEIQTKPAQLRGELQALMDRNITGRTGETVANAIVEFNHQYELERTKREGEEKMRKMSEEHLKETRQALNRILALLEEKGEPGALMKAAPAE
ncbi:MAG: hypothetical protein ACM33T_10160 [Solirubrobacterales bacterium]